MLKLELQLEPRPLSTEGVKSAWRDWVILLQDGLSLGFFCGCGRDGGETRTGPEW